MIEALNRIQKFLANNRNLLFIKLLDKQNNELLEVLATETNEEVEAEILADIETLDAGSYSLRACTAKNGSNKSAKFLPFTIKPEPKHNSGQFQNRTPQTSNIMSLEEINKMIEKKEAEAYERGVKDARMIALEKEVVEIKAEIKIIKQVINDHFDEQDGTDDDSFLNEVKSLALSKAGDMMSGFGSQS